ncbi:hypothetical protein G6F46_004982 [Rhizopus delemar]|uniref:Uncharacterized protein n=2 Tax=Rhizopus TaxID=4842 RepID=A0A9P6Z6A1_9FUNG|nr:hypothetical protein G6F55_003626 [Rhizopus delemar]KAG1631635.1 hypothetical protein G6F45_004667 [Rhizopus arrhizus]KAG1499587.1 hypothetical protein G6F54_004301 [Rhizopus delemar]KAG1513313.1 hypothetical protein G6F53_004518 [Rhizopus delemar]KAG1571339.1 hypothetical protein G6F50_004687 [Rhizopus delemar]
MIKLFTNKSPTSQLNQEPHAFDLTWKNYLPSISQFCCCFQRQGIRLEEEGEGQLIEPAYYNDHSLHRGETLQNYLDNSRDWEFESVLSQSDLPHFVTRNPFGTSKKKMNKRKKRQRRERPVIMETDLEEGDLHGYDIHEEDAEFLADDQIAHLAYNRYSKNIDQYGEDVYYNVIQGPIIQEMQTSKATYAARSVPGLQSSLDNEASNKLNPKSSTSIPQAELVDQTDNTIPAEEQNLGKLTLHIQQEEQIKQISDIDSIAASEALDEYENTAYSSGRYHANEDDFHLPSLVNNAPFVSDQHPFTYFTEQISKHVHSEEEEEEEDNNQGLKNAFNLGRKLLGV